MLITANLLINDYNFKKRSINKVAYLINERYNIKLIKKEDGSFYDKDDDKYYRNGADIITSLYVKDLDEKSEKFKIGLPQQNLNQGDFDKVYKENKQKGEIVFIPHERAKKILKAQFCYLISDALMSNSRGPNYEYKIIETKYEFRKSGTNSSNGGDLISLNLIYHYNSKYHDFYHNFVILSFDPNRFPINNRVGAYMTVDHLLSKFE